MATPNSYIATYLIILRTETEGQVLRLAKHCSAENRELTPPELQPEFQTSAPMKIILTETMCKI